MAYSYPELNETYSSDFKLEDGGFVIPDALTSLFMDSVLKTKVNKNSCVIETGANYLNFDLDSTTGSY